MDKDINKTDAEISSSVRHKINAVHDSNKGVAWIISMLIAIIAIFWSGGVIYKIFPTSSEELGEATIIGSNNNTIVISQVHPTTTTTNNNNIEITSPLETKEKPKSFVQEDLNIRVTRIERSGLWPALHPKETSSSQKKTLHHRPEGNLLSNGDLSSYYEPDWKIYIRNKEFSRIKFENQTLSLSFSGEGAGDKEVSVQQTVLIETTEDLMFSTTIKVSDRNGVGYAIAQIKLLDNSKQEIFNFSITPDSLYESSVNYELVNISFDEKKTVQIGIGKVIKSKLSRLLISSIKYVTVSYEISPPRQTRCKRCVINIFDSQLFYVKENI